MSQEVSLIFSGFVGILFMAVGILGIFRRNKFTQSIQNMYKLDGVLVEYTEHETRDEDNDIRTIYCPVYEYDWKGTKKRLYSTSSAPGLKLPAIGRQVHILVDPKTEQAICLEDEKSSMLVYLVFGVIGLLTFILVLVVGLKK